MIIHRHQRKTHGRTRGTSIAGGESRAPFSAARKDVQNRPGLRLRAGFSSVKTPPRGGFIVSSLNLGRAYGLGSLSRRFTSSRRHQCGQRWRCRLPLPSHRPSGTGCSTAAERQPLVTVLPVIAPTSGGNARGASDLHPHHHRHPSPDDRRNNSRTKPRRLEHGVGECGNLSSTVSREAAE